MVKPFWTKNKRTQPLRILITNLSIANKSGSETVAELTADGLRRAGHLPMLLAPTLGPQADRMRERGHIVVDRVAAVPEPPDLIHAQHIPVALSALAAFPAVPAVFVCHSAMFEVEAPRLHPQIRQWVAVDDLCKARCISRNIPEDRLTVILNAVDFERFLPRAPLPEKPRRALLLTKNHAHQASVRSACLAQGIALDALGPGTSRTSQHIEAELLGYDIVFATARMALEAAAIGCAVIVCDGRGFAGMLTAARLPAWRRLNFGAGLLKHPTGHDQLVAAISEYDPLDAATVTHQLRQVASLDESITQYLAVYAKALAEPMTATQSEIALATAGWIENLVPIAANRDWDVIAREIFNITAEPANNFLLGIETRLRDEIRQLAMLRGETDADGAWAELRPS